MTGREEIIHSAGTTGEGGMTGREETTGGGEASNRFRLGGDRTIDRLGFGAMRLPQSRPGGPARDPESSRAVLRRAVELGVDHIDTAAFYRSEDGSVHANTLIREALAPYPDDLVIATKVGPVFGPGGPRQGTAADIRPQVEANLESLGVDHLDLVYLRIGAAQPPHGASLADRFEALAALREEGLIRHLGISNVDVDHLAEARTIAPVAAVQNNFHIANRDETAVLDACRQAGIAFVPFFPLGGGRADLTDPALLKVADRHAATVPQIALAWLLTLSPTTLAIPGTGSIPHLEENLAARKITLTDEDLADLA
ncbi:oxidoreductase [Sphaerisporangium melleum]|uniref:Oxidoreductase n=1 Tax=Sphaerisporangium melleum TaxID=321316 RepID=A0A917RDP5_9ACTN|nr:aldo/keto reductase [Sphaerisporangium melleum]GGL03078.1 oxidoreductase [Sphaerisporangium melleum]GII69444.1 oxidoreductase [Sphaerisporangium melleum]